MAETGPTVTITISSTNLTASSPTTTVTFTFSEALASFSLSDTTATGGTLSNLQQTSPTVWTAVFTASSNIQTTTASVGVTAGSYQDSAGNSGPAGSSPAFSIDTNPNSWANPSGGSWTDPTNWSSGTAPSTSANVQIAPYGSTPYTVTVLSTASVSVSSLTLSDPNATLLDEGTLSILSSLVTSAGFLQISNGGTLAVGNASGFTVDFTGTGGNLVLGTSFTGTLETVSTADGAVTITGGGSVTTVAGDAVDLSALGGTQSNPANLSVNLTGSITGAATGISVIQNAYGGISIATSGSVVGQTGRGIFAEVGASGNGGILVDGSGNVTGGGSAYAGILAEILNPLDGSDVTVGQTGNVSGGSDGIKATTNGNGNVTVATGPNALINGTAQYGIIALSYGTGSLSVSTNSNDTITSGSAGIVAQSDATSIPQVGGVTTNSISITAAGTINSGSALTATANVPAGIIAGYAGATSGNGTPNAAVFGNVVVDNSANINAAGGDGIRAFNYGNGNITVADLAGTTIAAPGRYGILAANYGTGNVSVSTTTGDRINSGSTGIQASDNGTTVPSAATIDITAFGTIDSGLVSANNSQNGGIWAGFNAGGTSTVSSNVQGAVVVDSSAIINSASGVGIGLYNWGVGSLTATLETPSVITAPNAGVSAYAQGGGSVTVTNHGTITVSEGTGISTGTGNGTAPGSVGGLITVNNSGNVTALGSNSNPVIQINNDSTQSATFTNSGTITSDQFSLSNQNQAVGVYNGSVTINNSGTITGNVSLASGSSSVASATFNNNAGGIWNVNGSNYFGSGATAANAINNAGTINVSGVTVFSASGSLAFDNSDLVDLTPNSYAFIGGPVAGLSGISGTFSFGTYATLEFANSVAAGQTISFIDGNASLTLDDPTGFDGTLANLQIGDTIQLDGASIQSVAVNTETINQVTEYFLQVTSNNQPLFLDNLVSGVYEGVALSNFPAGSVKFSVLSSDDIQLVPFGAVPVTGPLAASSTPTNVTVNTFDILSNVTTTGSSGYGFAVSSSDATAGDFLTVEISQGSSIAGESGFNGVNLTTTGGANIALINAGTISSSGSGSSAINTNSGKGSTIIADYGNGAGSGNVTGVVNGIVANTTTGQINIVINSGASITGTSGFGISAVALGGNVIVNTSPGDTVTGGTSGINAQDQATSVSNSSISVSTYGTINSGAAAAAATNDPAAVRVAYTNGTADTPTLNVAGNITINSNANLNATWGSGLYAFDYGVGNISITDGSGTTITTSTAAPPAGSSQYGIGAFGYETGNTDVNMAFGSTITSGSTGINAVNQATATTSESSVTVIAQGTIDSGANGTNSGSAPAGIQAGFDPYDPTTKNNTNTFDSSVLGDILIDLAGGSILAAAGLGLKAFTYGIGNVVVEVQSGSSITAQTSSPVANGAPYGIGAFNYGPGNIAVTMSNGTTITSGSSGIDAVNEATTTVGYANPTVTVTAAGTINAGTILTNIGASPSGIAAGFLGGTTAATPNTAVSGSVVVNNAADINATNASPSSYGINAFNYGNGDVTVGDAMAPIVKGSVTGIPGFCGEWWRRRHRS